MVFKDSCEMTRSSGQGRDRTADTRIFSLTKRLQHTTEDYNETRTITVFCCSIIVADSGGIVPWSWNRDGTDATTRGLG